MSTSSRLRRERLDVGLFIRRLLGESGFRLVRLLPRWRVTVPKEYCVHGVVLLILGGVVFANLFTTSADRDSLLFALFGETEVEEGPAPVRPARERRGAFLGLISPAVAGGVSEDDIEFELANTLGGNALVATASPETAEASQARRSDVVAYTVREDDTPSSIGAKFGISTNTILWANGIRDGDIIRPGDILVILPVSGVLHTVASGDDVTSIAQRYDADVGAIIARNGLAEDGAIRIGQKLIVPDGELRVAPRRLAQQREEPSAEEEGEQAGEAGTAASRSAPPSVRAAGSGFLWPTVSRHVSQYFGWRHTGVDIPNRGRPSVVAARSGKVSFSGWLGGYGRLVILDHGDGLRTYYAHLGEAHAKTGETVSRGESIGRMGCTGRCTGPHVHFEVRSGGRPVNPLRYF